MCSPAITATGPPSVPAGLHSDQSTRIDMMEPRVPLFPVALFLSVLIAVFIEILSPMPGSFVAWLKDWQPLVAATVALCAALFAAYVAYRNTTATLALNGQQETQRRSRKHTATRAVLPLALAQISAYAEVAADQLRSLLTIWNADQGGLPRGAVPRKIAQSVPHETLKTLTDFIEFSDPPLNVRILELTIANIQIIHSRLSDLVRTNHDPMGVSILTKQNIEVSVLYAAVIYAGAEAMFQYARREQNRLPVSACWERVRNALALLRAWKETYPTLYATIDDLEKRGNDPLQLPYILFGGGGRPFP
jgi:hypothetical protein